MPPTYEGAASCEEGNVLWSAPCMLLKEHDMYHAGRTGGATPIKPSLLSRFLFSPGGKRESEKVGVVSLYDRSYALKAEQLGPIEDLSTHTCTSKPSSFASHMCLTVLHSHAH